MWKVALCAFLVAASGLELSIVNGGKIKGHWLPVNQYGGDCAADDASCTGGMHRLAAFLSKVRDEHPHVFTVVPGDFLTGTLFYNFYGGYIAGKFLNQLSIDGVALGYRERGSYNTSLFFDTFSGTRVVTNRPSDAALIPPSTTTYATLDYNGTVVAWIACSNIPSYEVVDVLRQLRGTVAQIHDLGVKHIILSFFGTSPTDIQDVVKNIVGIDVVIVDYAPYAFLRLLGISFDPDSFGDLPLVAFDGPDGRAVPIIGAFQNLAAVSALHVSFSPNGVVTGYTHEYHVLNATWDVNGTLYNQMLSSLLADDGAMRLAFDATIVGETSAMLTGTEATCRFSECGVSLLACDALRWKTGVQIASWNGGAFYFDIPAGPISIAELLQSSPFQNYLVIFTVSGANLREAIEWGLKNAGDPGCWERSDCAGQTGAFLHFAGLRHTWTRELPSRQRLTSVEVEAGPGVWEPLDLDQNYTFATNNYIAGGGDGFGPFWGEIDLGADSSSIGEVRFEDLVIEYLDHVSVYTPVGGRITETTRLPPIILAVSPSAGSSEGFFTVTLQGSGFGEPGSAAALSTTVALGGVACEDAVVVNDTYLTCIAGKMTAVSKGVVRAVVTNDEEGPSMDSVAGIALIPGCPRFSVISAISGECVCRAGYVRVEDQCVACPAGAFSSDDGSVNCTLCPLGSAGAAPASTGCAACEPGTYSPRAGLARCVPCPGVRSTPATLDVACPGGCPYGSYQPESNKSHCLSCPDGLESVLEGQRACLEALSADSNGGLNSTEVVGLICSAIVALMLFACCYKLLRPKKAKRYRQTIQDDGDSTVKVGGGDLAYHIKRSIENDELRLIGKGGFATVYEMELPFAKETVAVKVMNDVGPDETDDFHTELNVLTLLYKNGCHPNVISLAFSVEDRELEVLALGLTYAPHGTLHRWNRKRKRTEVQRVRSIAEFARGLAYVHNNLYSHLDIKSKNALVSADNTVLVCDFGTAVATGADGTSRDSKASVFLVGTPQYISPERLSFGGDEASVPVDLFKADVYSFGITMWAILRVEDPFKGVKTNDVLRRVRSEATYRPPISFMDHKCISELAQECWKQCTEDRPSMREIASRVAGCLSECFGEDLPDDVLLGDDATLRLSSLAQTNSSAPTVSTFDVEG